MNRELRAEQQRRLGPMPGRLSGNPNNPLGTPPESPSRLQCMLLSTSDSISAMAWDTQRKALLVANGTFVDVMVQEGIYWHRIQSIDIGETVNAISTYDRRAAFATPTKVVYRDDYRNQDTQATIPVTAEDVLSWSTAEDTNPSWASEVTASYQSEPPSATRGNTPNFPENFLIVATAAEVTIFDLASGAPVMWMVFQQGGGFVSWVDNTLNMIGNPADISALDYRDGQLYLSSSTSGIRFIDFVQDRAFINAPPEAKIYNSTILDRNANSGYEIDSGQPPIVVAQVNDVAATVLDTVETTNLLDVSEDLTAGSWIKFGGNATEKTFTEDTSTGQHRVGQSEPFVNGNTYTASVTLINKGRRYVQFRAQSASSVWQANVTFDLQQGTIIAEAEGSGTILADGDGFRCTVTGVAVSDATTEVQIRFLDDTLSDNYTGDGVSGVVATDWQLEQSANPHAYVPSVTGPTTGQTPPARQLINDDIGGGELKTKDTGLFIPAWSVATDGGVSVGVDTGDVWDITGQSEAIPFVDFLSNGDILTIWQFTSEAGVYAVPSSDITVANFRARYYTTNAISLDAAAPKLVGISPNQTYTAAAAIDGQGFSWGTGTGLSVLFEDVSDYFDGMVSHITAADPDGYNTGYMVDPSGAWANDTDTAAIGFPWDLYEDFDAKNVTVFTDDFNRTDPAPWQDAGGTGDVEIIASQLVQINTFGAFSAVLSNAPGAYSFTAGKWYTYTAEYFGDGPARVEVTGTPGGAIIAQSDNVIAGQTAEVTFQATAANNTVAVRALELNPADTGVWDNVLIEEVPALDGLGIATGFEDGTAEIESGALRLTAGAGGFRARYTLATTIGTNYIVTFSTLEAGSASNSFAVSNAQDLSAGLTFVSLGAAQDYKISFTATATTTYVGAAIAAGLTELLDNITVQESLIENPTLDSDTSGWTPTGTATIASVNGELEVTGGGGGTDSGQQTVAVVSGKAYSLQFKGYLGTAASGVFRATGAADIAVAVDATPTDYIESFVAVTNSLVLDCRSTVAGTTYWDNVILTEALPDNSGQGNDAQVIGQVTRVKFNRCTYGVCCDDINYVRLTGSANDDLQGWYKDDSPGAPWRYFENSSEIPQIEKDGNDYLLKNGCYGFLMLSGSSVDLGGFGPGFGEGFD